MKISKPLTIFQLYKDYYEKEDEYHYYSMKIKVSKAPKNKMVACSTGMYNGVITKNDVKFDYVEPTKRLCTILISYNIELTNDNQDKHFRHKKEKISNPKNKLCYEW